MSTTSINSTIPGRGTTVELANVGLSAGGKSLLEKGSARFEPGQITLIVGASGAGKSLLLRALAGLTSAASEGVRLTGRILFDGQAQHGRQAAGKVGVVFQNFALFDELSPEENVRFARAHRARRAGRPAPPEAGDLLDELRVPRGVPTARLSGGQRQRLALARTLAYDPDVILYDEPTSGLDKATASEVAALIRQTHLTHPQTSIIVTHDYESLAPLADKIYLLDARTKTLREIPRQDWPRLRDDLAPAPVAAEPLALGWKDRLLGGLLWSANLLGDFFDATTRTAAAVLLAPLSLLPVWKSPAWGLRYFLHYLRLVAGPSAWVYIAVSGMIIGFVTTYFTFRFLPYALLTKPLLIEDLLHSMGFALFRILVPILASILVAARCGAAVASDVGGKVYSQQVDALRTFGVRPERYLLTGVLFAFIIGGPLLTAIGYVAASLTSLVVFTATHGELGPEFWSLHYHRRLVTPGEWLFDGTYWLLAKTLLCSVGPALLAYHLGVAPKLSSRDVSHGITRVILWATLWVLAVHFAFAFWEFV